MDKRVLVYQNNNNTIFPKNFDEHRSNHKNFINDYVNDALNSKTKQIFVHNSNEHYCERPFHVLKEC